MKKIKLMILISALVLGLVACSDAKDNEPQVNTQVEQSTTENNLNDDKSQQSGDAVNDTENQTGNEADSTDNQTDDLKEETNSETGNSQMELNGEDKTNASSDNTEENMDENKQEVVDGKYAYMLGSSVVTTGNNYRFKQFMKKVRAGEQVNVVTLGGSITEGGNAKPMSEGYAYKFEEAFKETYGGNVNFVNAGLSGTPSALGVMRYEKDVLNELGGAPDLLFIEFAVNDWQEATNGRALESLIYQALTDNSDCAVILIFTVTNKDWNLQKDMMPYGYYYKLPMLSMQNALKNAAITPEEYFNDEFHPSNKGHIVMKDCLMTLIDKLDKEEESEPFEIPEEVKKGRNFTHMKLVTADSENVAVNIGSFTGVDTEIQNFQVKKIPSFPNNFMHEEGSDALTMKMTCKEILLDFKTASSNKYGEAEIVVDGEVVMTVNGYSAGGWNNSNVVLVLDSEEEAEHTLEVRMVAGQEDKKFTVLGVAIN